MGFCCVFETVHNGHQLVIIGHRRPHDSDFFWLGDAIPAKMILALTTFKHHPATAANRRYNVPKRAYTVRASIRGQQPIRFRERVNDFGLNICGSTHSGALNGGLKKTAAYQALGRKHRVEDDVKQWPYPVMCGVFQDAITIHQWVSSQCCGPQICYKSRVVYFSSFEFFTGFWPLVTGHWLLAPGLWQLVSCHGSLAACLQVGQQQEASSQ